MLRPIPPAFWKTFSHLRWIAIGCLTAFMVERLVYNLFDIGTLHHRSPGTVLWLFALPLLGFAFVLFRSPILSSRSRAVRIVALSITCVLLAAAFPNFSF